MRKRIFLTGFMGTGKTSTAMYISGLLGWEHIDTDELLMQRLGGSIPEIFELIGESGFRDEESALLKEMSTTFAEPCVVSCGGGMSLREENRRQMDEYGLPVLLEATPETVLQRIEKDDLRPLLSGKMNIETITKLMAERRELYHKTTEIIINTDGLTIAQVGMSILTRKELIPYLLFKDEGFRIV